MDLKDGSSAARASAEIHERAGLWLSIVALAGSVYALSRVEGAKEVADAHYKDLEGRYLVLNDKYNVTEREARMLEYYVLELDGKLMAGGLIPAQRGYENFKRERTKQEK